jgi:hypothetical protein
MKWNGKECNGMKWNGMGRSAMKWDGMGWDGRNEKEWDRMRRDEMKGKRAE